MGLLDGAWCYLSGAMEFAPDDGVLWRKKFAKLVEENGLNIELLDPTDKPGGGDGHINEDKKYQSLLQSSGKFKELQQYVKNYRRMDLRFTDLSDFIVVMISPHLPQWGTSNEVYLSESQKKPIFFICEDGLYKLPKWLFGVIGKISSNDPLKAMEEANVFDSVEGVVKKLVSLDRGDEPLNNQWVLIRKYISRRKELKCS